MSGDAKVHTILLVLCPGDSHGLLRLGLCGTSPPMTWLRNGDAALVLAWEGAVVPEGMDRLRRRVWDLGCSTELWVGVSEMTLTLEQVAVLVQERAAPLLGGRCVMLDVKGREVCDG